MNDVFVPIKADKQEIQDVLFIQSAVPKIKLFLHYIRKQKTELLNLPFFIGIEELLKGLIFFVLEIKNLYTDPFEVEGVGNQQRQKLMRECRLIDLVIDCLVYPFETKMYNIDELTMKHPITRICRLVYRLLKHCVKDCSLNKNYVAQWIDLFFRQAMMTTEENNFTAEKTIAELLVENYDLLENQIESTTIVNLVNLCLEQPKHERFLNLLSGLCSCEADAITSNQDDICETMLENNQNKQRLFFFITT